MRREPLLQLPDTTLRETAHHMVETTVHSVTRHGGVAGQHAYTVEVSTTTYPTGDERDAVTDESTITLVGSVYGSPGPVVMVIGPHQMFVTDPGRFGSVFDRAWAYRFAMDREV